MFERSFGLASTPTTTTNNPNPQVRMASGKVKWFDNKKGFGFIVIDSGQDVFVHHSSILGAGFKTLNEGELVTFEVVQSAKGLKAQNVQRTQVGQ